MALWPRLYTELRHTNYKLLLRFSLVHKVFTALANWALRGSVLCVDAREGRVWRTQEALLPRAPQGVRVVVLSDTHLWHRQLWVPQGDVLLHAGDCLAEWGNGVRELQDFAAWLGGLPHAEKLVVGGNHDRCLQELGPARVAELLWKQGGAIYLHPELCDSVVLASGLRVAGNPWSVRTNPRSGNTAFQPEADDPRHSQVPACDVLVTHGPPRGVLDMGRGSTLLQAAVQSARPRLHAFGHVHEAHGAVVEGGRVCVNAAMCNDLFCAVRRPIVVDLPIPAQRAPPPQLRGHVSKP
mmetsp:Transcript_54567/g.170550  ORF Transcript_54567/g.170550 Transcript_54567/m.170550 type:complete len:296 (-) Transcript_54567:30-917(-)